MLLKQDHMIIDKINIKIQRNPNAKTKKSKKWCCNKIKAGKIKKCIIEVKI